MGKHKARGISGAAAVAPAALASAAAPMEADAAAGPSTAAAEASTGAAAPGADGHTSADYYFDSYAHFGIHEEMLKDNVRTKTYQQAICNNDFLFKDKIVLDVGCGTGILSLFAAKTGAKHVYAVECSDIADTAREIVAVNGYADRITVIKGKLEEITLPVDKVDVIISEWMGYFLFYESMLDTVLLARDRWLAPGGAIFPDKATVMICAIEDAQYKSEKIDFWDDVYGFDFRCIRKMALAEPLVDTVAAEQVVSSVACVKTIDIMTMTVADCRIDAPFELKALRNDYVHALVAYFDVSFNACHKPLFFSTGPKARSTHWKQTVFYLDTAAAVCTGETLSGRLTCVPNARNPRDLDIAIQYTLQGKRVHLAGAQEYRMR